MSINQSVSFRKQQGAATLIVTVVLLALLTITVLSLTNTTNLELKTAANSNRTKEGLATSQGGLDYAAMHYLANKSYWASVASVSISIPPTSGVSVSVTGSVSDGLLSLSSLGGSQDGTASVTTSEDYGTTKIGEVGELPPLMAGGNIPLSGGFSIVANPNGGGDGVPVSAWVKSGDIGGQANWSSCNLDEFLYSGTNVGQSKTTVGGFTYCDTCECNKVDSGDLLCDSSSVGSGNSIDGICNDFAIDPDIPSPFTTLFGYEDSEANYDKMRALYGGYTCNDLDANIGEELRDYDTNGRDKGQLPAVWIEEDCAIDDVGSAEFPVIVVIEGDMTVNANSVSYGVLFNFDPDITSTPDYDLKANGGAVVYGSVLVSGDAELPNGTFNLVYSQNVLEELFDDGAGYEGVARAAGSWRDF